MTKKQTRRKHKSDIVFGPDDKHMTKQDTGGINSPGDVARAYLSGRMQFPDVPPPVFADLTVVDVDNARNIVADLNSAFEELPSTARDALKYDPRNYVTFLEDNSEAIGEFGLATVMHREFVESPRENKPVSDETEIRADSAENGATEADGLAPDSTVDPT